jgi:hypothetical protein
VLAAVEPRADGFGQRLGGIDDSSAIDPTKPAQDVPASKADLRANLAAAKAEIESLQAPTPRSIKEFGMVDSSNAAATKAANTIAFQNAVDSGEQLFVPPGLWWITEPISYVERLHIQGVPAGLLGSSQATIRGDFAGPLFHSRGVVLNPNNTLTGTGATSSLVGLTNLTFDNRDQGGSCVQLHNIRGTSYISRCVFSHRFRGLVVMGSTFGVVVLGNRFVNAWTNRTHETWDYENAWALSVAGHTTCIENQFTGCGVGAVLVSTNANFIGGRVEVSGIGLQLGGFQTSPGSQFGLTFPLSRALVSGLSLEQNYRGIWARYVAAGVTVQGIGIDGSPGPHFTSKYGLHLANAHPSSTFQDVDCIGEYTEAALKFDDTEAYVAPTVRGTNTIGPKVIGEPGRMRGTTAARPAATKFYPGEMWYDMTLGKPLFSDGTVWRNADGTTA